MTHNNPEQARYNSAATQSLSDELHPHIAPRYAIQDLTGHPLADAPTLTFEVHRDGTADGEGMAVHFKVTAVIVNPAAVALTITDGTTINVTKTYVNRHVWTNALETMISAAVDLQS